MNLTESSSGMENFPKHLKRHLRQRLLQRVGGPTSSDRRQHEGANFKEAQGRLTRWSAENGFGT